MRRFALIGDAWPELDPRREDSGKFAGEPGNAAEPEGTETGAELLELDLFLGRGGHPHHHRRLGLVGRRIERLAERIEQEFIKLERVDDALHLPARPFEFLAPVETGNVDEHEHPPAILIEAADLCRRWR